MACDTNEVHEGAAHLLLRLNIKCPVTAAFENRTALKLKLHKRQIKGSVTTYYESVNYFLEMYMTDDVIAETPDSMMQFTQARNKSAT